MEISVFTNRHGQRNYGLVLHRGQSGMVELLLDPFAEFPNASAEAKRPRIRWVQPTTQPDGPGTRIEPLNGQRIAWRTREIRELIAGGDAMIADRYPELLAKFSGSS